MKKNLWFSPLATRSVLLLTLLILAAPTSHAQQTRQAGGTCVIEIHSPANGDRVNRSATVKGRAVIPPEAFVWVLVQMDGLGADHWWPQPAGPIEVNDKDGSWKATAFFGEGHDIGSNFVVAAVAVDAQRNAEMKSWLSRRLERGNVPTNFPESLHLCSSIPQVIVEKRGH